jgi:hypothetical protein
MPSPVFEWAVACELKSKILKVQLQLSPLAAPFASAAVLPNDDLLIVMCTERIFLASDATLEHLNSPPPPLYLS